MALQIAYKIPFLARALRQRDQARRLVEILTRRNVEMALRLQLAEALAREGHSAPPAEQAPARTAWRDIRAPVWTHDMRVCVYVAFMRDAEVAPHAAHAMAALRKDGFYVICLAVRDDVDAPMIDPGPDIADAFCARANAGWDFGAWAAMFARHPRLWEADSLLLMNDSVIGPLRAMDDIWLKIAQSPASVFGLVESFDVQRHIQSFWMFYKAEALRNPTLRAFWRTVRNLDDKDEVIAAYEVNTIRLCEIAGLAHEAIFPCAPEDERTGNPSFWGWRRLAARGYPFIKLRLLTETPDNIDLSDWVAVLHRAGLDGQRARDLLAAAPAQQETARGHARC
ncbi:hypothetical protein M2323_002131 [Rhodoblastus acidophilus]|uniref:rhamnan synthesis F family protein n=1 Tax=Rhodoblastus acidophilus TaxID=1074 RepID=UPI002224227F|nr:rhamnan synthesis F family protein [Rhodoblastus acidophilus]MCW2284320.1 hypothetical protein [Rhodoblastus acidophilus]MCW2333202.1 hypothetical protein [Rhodoblastus acidophilus]